MPPVSIQKIDPNVVSADSFTFSDFITLLSYQYGTLLVSLGFAAAAFAANWWSANSLNASLKDKIWWRKIKKPNLRLFPLDHSSTADAKNERPVRIGMLALIWNLMYIPQAIAIWIAFTLPQYQAIKMTAQAAANGQQVDPSTLPQVSWWIVGSYAVQLFLNATYGVSLFYIRDLSLAFLTNMLLTPVVIYNVSAMGNVSTFASYIVTPYALFTLYLLVGIGYMWYLNEGKEAMAELTGKNLSGSSSAAAGKKKPSVAATRRKMM